MYLVVDTETTGLVKNLYTPWTDSSNWPRLVQISWIMIDDNQVIHDCRSYLIKPDDFEIPNSAIAIHGITNKMAQNNGSVLPHVLSILNMMVQQADAIVAHNVSFDIGVIGAEMIRMQMDVRSLDKPAICTMRQSSNYCRLQRTSGNRYKWPSLQQLHHKLFYSHYEGEHKADSDVRACAKCFFELKRLGIISTYDQTNVNK